MQTVGLEEFVEGGTAWGSGFAGAELVVAVGGAALANIVSMPPGGTVVMIGPATMAGCFFRDLATHCDHELIVMWGENDDPSAGGMDTEFRIDAGALGDAVAQAARERTGAVRQ